MDESSQNSEKNWLIRSSTRILGPFTLNEVTKLLSSKQVSIIDEIRQPLVRWSYIRENRVFLDLVRDLRQAEDNAVENTMTMTATLSSQTQTQTQKLDAAEVDFSDLTPIPAGYGENPRAVPGIKDITGTEGTISKPLGVASKSFGSFQDPLLRQRLEKKAQRVRGLVIVMAVLALAGLGYSFLNREGKKVSDSEVLTNLALKYKNIGLYDKALDAYKRLQITREPDFDLQYQMAPLLISEDRQSLIGRRILEKAVVGESRSREDLLDSDIGLALTYMQEGDLKEAENYLQKAMTYEPNNPTAQTNMAIIQLKKGSYIAGARDLDALSRRAPRSNLLLVLRAIAWIEASRVNVDRNALASVNDSIKAIIERPAYLGQELSLLSIDIAKILHDTTAYEEALKKFIDQVPFRSNQYLRNYMIDWRMSQWDYLEKYCADIFSDIKLSALEKGARAICLMEVNRDEDAVRLITEGLSEMPRNAQLLAIEASYFMKVGRSTEALNILKMLEVQSLPLGRQLTGMICMQQGKVDCTKSAYKSLYDGDRNNVYALYGLAWVSMQESQRGPAYEYAKAGLLNEPGYLPLIELRDRLEAQ